MTTTKAPLWRVFLYALMLSAAVLFFCSKSSFAYPINDWSDANIYFSAGKGILSGRVMYRDLYDHKGPLIYGLHALCAWLSPLDFTGVYGLETLFAALFLTVAHRLLALYGGERAAWLALPLVAAMVYTSYSFQAGDSAEEWALPMLLFSLYDLMRYLKADAPAPMSAGRLTLEGFLLGCIFWLKFTLCGLQAGVLLMLLWAHGKQKNSVWRCLGWLAMGFCLSTLPWLVYFGINHAIQPWLKTYLYDNLFLYSKGEGLGLAARLKQMVRSALEWLMDNPLYAVPTVAGVVWLSCRKRAVRWERAGWLLCFGLCALGAWVAGKSYPYYALPLAAFLPAFFILPCQWLEGRLQSRPQWTAACAAGLCALGVGLCPVLSPNVAQSFGEKRENTMQYQFAAVIDQTPGATLLNYGFMDAGFYTAAGITPTVKYYHQTNVPLPEMLDEQIRYIENEVCDYVVTRGEQPECINDGYDLIATADSPGFWYEHVYLYRVKDKAIR